AALPVWRQICVSSVKEVELHENLWLRQPAHDGSRRAQLRQVWRRLLLGMRVHRGVRDLLHPVRRVGVRGRPPPGARQRIGRMTSMTLLEQLERELNRVSEQLKRLTRERQILTEQITRLRTGAPPEVVCA